MGPSLAKNKSAQLKSHCDDIESVFPSFRPEMQQSRRFTLFFKAAVPIWNSCVACSLIGGFFLSSGIIATKKLDEDHVSVFQSFLVRGVIALPILMPFSYVQTGHVMGPLDHNMKWIVLRGVCAACALLFNLVSVTLIPLSEAAFLNDTYPAFMAFISWILGIESIDPLSWIGILGAIMSNVLIMRPPFLFGEDDSTEWNSERIAGLMCSFACVICRSSGFLLVGKIDKSVPSVVIGNHQVVLLAIISIPFLAFGSPKKIDWNLSPELIGLYVVAASSAFNQALIIRAFQIGPPVVAAVCSLVRVLMTVSAGILLFSEELTLLSALGGLLLLSSISLVIWSRDREKDRQSKEPLLTKASS